jgi:hypothetical protein
LATLSSCRMGLLSHCEGPALTEAERVVALSTRSCSVTLRSGLCQSHPTCCVLSLVPTVRRSTEGYVTCRLAPNSGPVCPASGLYSRDSADPGTGNMRTSGRQGRQPEPQAELLVGDSETRTEAPALMSQTSAARKTWATRLCQWLRLKLQRRWVLLHKERRCALSRPPSSSAAFVARLPGNRALRTPPPPESPPSPLPLHTHHCH